MPSEGQVEDGEEVYNKAMDVRKWRTKRKREKVDKIENRREPRNRLWRANEVRGAQITAWTQKREATQPIPFLHWPNGQRDRFSVTGPAIAPLLAWTEQVRWMEIGGEVETRANKVRAVSILRSRGDERRGKKTHVFG